MSLIAQGLRGSLITQGYGGSSGSGLTGHPGLGLITHGLGGGQLVLQGWFNPTSTPPPPSGLPPAATISPTDGPI